MYLGYRDNIFVSWHTTSVNQSNFVAWTRVFRSVFEWKHQTNKL